MYERIYKYNYCHHILCISYAIIHLLFGFTPFASTYSIFNGLIQWALLRPICIRVSFCSKIPNIYCHAYFSHCFHLKSLISPLAKLGNQHTWCLCLYSSAYKHQIPPHSGNYNIHFMSPSTHTHTHTPYQTRKVCYAALTKGVNHIIICSLFRSWIVFAQIFTTEPTKKARHE